MAVSDMVGGRTTLGPEERMMGWTERDEGNGLMETEPESLSADLETASIAAATRAAEFRASEEAAAVGGTPAVTAGGTAVMLVDAGNWAVDVVKFGVTGAAEGLAAEDTVTLAGLLLSGLAAIVLL